MAGSRPAGARPASQTTWTAGGGRSMRTTAGVLPLVCTEGNRLIAVSAR